MREWEIGAVENIHGALPYIRFAPILALVGVGVNRIGKERTIVIEFDNFDAAVAHYDTPGYQEALKVLGDGAVRDMRVVEGVE